MLILKYWLKVKGLVNTDKCKSYFSSYVFYLLVLNFFVKNIEKCDDDNIDNNIDENIDESTETTTTSLLKINKSKKQKTTKLFELILNFFIYYTNFDFLNYKISINETNEMFRVDNNDNQPM